MNKNFVELKKNVKTWKSTTLRTSHVVKNNASDNMKLVASVLEALQNEVDSDTFRVVWNIDFPNTNTTQFKETEMRFYNVKTTDSIAQLYAKYYGKYFAICFTRRYHEAFDSMFSARYELRYDDCHCLMNVPFEEVGEVLFDILTVIDETKRAKIEAKHEEAKRMEEDKHDEAFETLLETLGENERAYIRNNNLSYSEVLALLPNTKTSTKRAKRAKRAKK